MGPPLQVLEISCNGLSVLLNSEMELVTSKDGRLISNGDMLPEEHMKMHNVIDNIINGNPDEFTLMTEMNHDTYIRFSYSDVALIEYMTMKAGSKPVTGISTELTHEQLCNILAAIKQHWLMSRNEIAEDALDLIHY